MPKPRLFVSAALLLGAAAAALTLAGPLDPPAGPVAPTYKTLTEVEPRTPIGPTTTPGDSNSIFRIAAPGSYYLTGNITGQSSKSAIEIASAGVTLDLNGFTLQGVPGSIDGISSDLAPDGITVRNGTISGFGEDGIDLQPPGFTSRAVLVENIHVRACGLRGIALDSNCIVRACTATDTAGDGITANTGAAVESCTVRNPGGSGIALGNECVVRACAVFTTATGGIVTGAAATVAQCSVTDAGTDGIATGMGCTISECTVRSSGGNGITGSTGSIVRACTVQTSNLDGIRVTAACTVLDNVCQSNGFSTSDGADIHATGADSRIEGNNCTSADRGIDVTGAGNIIIRNTCSGNAVDWSIAANNIFGPILDRRAPASAAVSGFSAPSSLGSTDPGANYSY